MIEPHKSRKKKPVILIKISGGSRLKFIRFQSWSVSILMWPRDHPHQHIFQTRILLTEQLWSFKRGGDSFEYDQIMSCKYMKKRVLTGVKRGDGNLKFTLKSTKNKAN